MNPESNSFKLTMNALNRYIYINKLDPAMAQRLRDYFHRTRHMFGSSSSTEVLRRLSPKMQGDVLLRVNEEWLQHVPWLAEEDSAFLAEVVLALVPAVFPPEESIDYSALFVLTSGMAIHGGVVLQKGRVWGEDMLLALPVLRNRASARALSYVEVFYIDRDNLLRIAHLHFETERRLKRRILFMALQLFDVHVARTNLHKPQLEHLSAVSGKSPHKQKSGVAGKWQMAMQRHSTFKAYDARMSAAVDEAKRREMDREARVNAARERDLHMMLYRLVEHGNICAWTPVNSPAPSRPCTTTPGARSDGELQARNEWEARDSPPPSSLAQQRKPGATSVSFGSNGNGSGEQIGSQSKLVSQKRRPRPAQERLEQSRAELHGLTSQVEAMRKEAAEAARERAQILAAVQELRGMLGKPAGGQSPTGGTGGLNA